MKITQIFNKMKGELSGALSKVAGKAENVAKISKLKFEIVTRKSAINSCYQEMGEYIYSKQEEYSKDSFLANVFKEIGDLKNKNEMAQKAIDELKLSAKEEI